MTTPIGGAACDASNDKIKEITGSVTIKLQKDNTVPYAPDDVVDEDIDLGIHGTWLIEATAKTSSFGSSYRNQLTFKATLIG